MDLRKIGGIKACVQKVININLQFHGFLLKNCPTDFQRVTENRKGNITFRKGNITFSHAL